MWIAVIGLLYEHLPRSESGFARCGGDGRAGGVFLGVRSGLGGWLYGEAEVSAWAVIVLMLRQELSLRLLFV